MDAIVVLLISLSMAFFLSRLCVHLSLPSLLGPLLTGIIFSIPWVQELVPISNLSGLFAVFSDLGIILLLFYIGLKINIHRIKKSSRDVTFITLLSTFIPVVLTFLLVLWLGHSWIAALSIAAVLAVSDESVSLVLLDEAKLVRTKVGQLIISTGVLDDVLSVLFLGILTIVFASSAGAGLGILRLLLEVAILVVFLVLLHYVIIPFTHRYYTQTHFRHKYDLFTVTLILVLLLATFSHYLHFGFAFGALLAGIIVRSSFDGSDRRGLVEEREIDDMFRTVTFGFVILFFFIAIGLNIDFSSLNWLLIASLVIIGLFGKWVGALLGFRLAEGKSSFRLANLIGWGLGSRGAMALIVLEIARAHDIIPANLFSSVIFVAIITTIIAPIVFRFFVKQRAHHFRSHHL
ncbi:MAG: cation:proton antiporter [Candidatus Woesearchaeota archaeon]